MSSKSSKPVIYLIGGMEQEAKLGAGWREFVTPKLEELGFEVLNPVLFERDQLKGLHINRLPKTLLTRSGKTIEPTFWHQLKLAPFNSSEFRRFTRYMRRIIAFDMDVVKNQADMMLVNWTTGAGRGAGSHAEINTAYENRKPVYAVVAKGVDYPAWLMGCTDMIFENFDECLTFLANEG